MTYLPDTNVCIRFLNQPDSGIAKRLQQQHVNDITVCSVVKSELFFGAMKSRWPDRTLQKQLAFLQLFKSWPFDNHAVLQSPTAPYSQGKRDAHHNAPPDLPHAFNPATTGTPPL